MDQNPYAAPSAELLGQSDDAAQTRNTYLKHEASVKSMGLLYYFGGASTLLIGLASLFVMVVEPSEFASMQGVFAIIFVVLVVMGALGLYGGRQLRLLSEKCKVPVAIFSGLGLLSFPLGTLVNGYILYLVFSKKGEVVLSEDYKKVIEQTPNIQYKTPIYIWILLALIIGAVALAVAFA